MSASDIQRIPYVVDIEEFHGGDADIGSDVANELAKHPHCKLVAFRNSPSIAEALKAICTAQGLHYLYLDEAVLDSESFRTLRSCMNLSILSLQESIYDENYLSCISECHDLSALFLIGKPISIRSLNAFANLRKLEILEFTSNAVFEEHVEALALLSSLRVLRIEGAVFTSRSLLKLSRFGNLEKLFIEKCPISNDVLASLAGSEIDLIWISSAGADENVLCNLKHTVPGLQVLDTDPVGLKNPIRE